MALSYKPLMHTLLDNDMQLTDLVELIGCSSKTLAKFKKNEPVAITTLEKICLKKGWKIQDVVEILPEGEG